MAEFTREQIAEASLAVADDRGAAGFTMRAVADALGVTPMALYHYVEDKAALVALVVDASIAEHPLPPPTGSWQEDLFAMARWMRNTMLAHPAVARLRSAHNVWTPSIFPMTERWLSLWQQSGLELNAALLAASASSTAMIGFVQAELLYADTKLPDDSALSSFPNARVAFNLTRDGTREFDLVVRSLLDGLHARLAAAGPPAPVTVERVAGGRTTRPPARGPAAGKRATSRSPRSGS
jgi:AcrR family transcriptional regulator